MEQIVIFTVVWTTLVIVGGITELVALANRRAGDTLSEHVWRIVKVGDPRPSPFVWILRAAIALVVLWLAGHFAMGWWTP